MAYLISTILFLSGMAALIFEVIWFRLTGLILGNTVWAAALVMSGFMGGLAFGNALVARYSHRIAYPLKFYAALELLIGITGFSLVLLLPQLVQSLVPLFHQLAEQPWLLNPLRLIIAFVLMLVPTTAMGATLPLLVKALSRLNPNFGSVLGRLYGWNTLGAVFGVLTADLLLIQYFGLRGAGLCAVLVNLSAVAIALRIARADVPVQKNADIRDATPKGLGLPAVSFAGKRLLWAAALSGGIMLALEVVWFRFLSLFATTTSLVFAVMLTIVLVGIGAGGILAAAWYTRSAQAHKFLRPLTLFAGVFTVATYWLFDQVFYFAVETVSNTSVFTFVTFAVFLMLPVSVISGVLFTLLGRAAKSTIKVEARTAGLLTMANTLGAMFGALIGGFLLLPVVGMEMSFFLLAACYGLTALVIPAQRESIPRSLSYAGVAIFLVSLALFPFGNMDTTIFAITDQKNHGGERVAVREGIAETSIYYRYDRFGEPLHYRLATNGFSMSGTTVHSKRYMKLYVYWPVALHPDLKSALLVSYGVGSTAKALTDTRQLQSIDIVDISREILELSAVVYPDPGEHPLFDERVNVHIEDGRFFLQTTDKRFDLITSEPPPPKLAGVVNLYTQEYFELIRERLTDGGMTTYWLPVHQLNEQDTSSVIKGFCNAFPDCSLWAGSGLDWMLIGTRNATGQVSAEHFRQQWKDPVVASELRAMGLEHPGQLGALFMADSVDLKSLTQNTPALTDNYPGRLTPELISSNRYSRLFALLMDTTRAREAFVRSDFITGIWPRELRDESLEFFEYQRLITDHFAADYQRNENYIWEDLYRTLTRTSLRTLPLWLLGSTQREQDILAGLGESDRSDAGVQMARFQGAIADRDYDGAVEYFQSFMQLDPQAGKNNQHLHLFALAMAGQYQKVTRVGNSMYSETPPGSAEQQYLEWINQTFEVSWGQSQVPE